MLISYICEDCHGGFTLDKKADGFTIAFLSCSVYGGVARDVGFVDERSRVLAAVFFQKFSHFLNIAIERGIGKGRPFIGFGFGTSTAGHLTFGGRI